MDSKDRDESAIRQREAALARRLGDALDQLNPQSAKDCPDAEIIAAYAERALGEDELARCENHFASCGRCRNILRVLAAASDAPLAETEVAQLGQRVSAVRAPVEITAGTAKRPRSKAADWSTRWLAPAFGIAAVLAVWFVMRPPWRAMDRSGSPTLIAQAPRQEIPENAVPPPVEQAQKIAPSPEAYAAKNASPNSNAEPPTKQSLKPENEIPESSPNANTAENLPSEKKESAAGADGNKAKLSGMPPPTAAPPQPMITSRMNPTAPLPQSRAQADSSAPAKSEAPRATSQPDAVSQVAPVAGAINPSVLGSLPPPESDLPINGRNFQPLRKLRSAQGIPILLKSASGSTFWRVGIAGVIERSSDAGKTWSPQVSPSKEDWLSGTAISDTVCWIAGRNGAIARTRDGANWESVTPPSQAAPNNGKMPDWIVITARDAQSATIAGNDTTKFVTSDGGKTWQRQ
jgi:Photosynthesis system II assembly factor YCF48